MTVQAAARRRGSKCYLLISQSKKPPEETHTDRHHQSVVQVMKTLKHNLLPLQCMLVYFLLLWWVKTLLLRRVQLESITTKIDEQRGNRSIHQCQYMKDIHTYSITACVQKHFSTSRRPESPPETITGEQSICAEHPKRGA